MHFLFAALLWVISLGSAYGVGKGWVESKHAGGWPRVAAWALAALSALGFTSAYFLVVVAAVQTFTDDALLRDQLETVWVVWYAWVLAPLGGLAGASFFASWGRQYRDELASRANYPSYVEMNAQYGAIRTVPQAARAVTADVTRRTRGALLRKSASSDPPPYISLNDGGNAATPTFRLPHLEMPKVDLGKLELGEGKDDDSGKAMVLVLCVVALVIAICLGVITTWVVIARVAGASEPLPVAASGRGVQVSVGPHLADPDGEITFADGTVLRGWQADLYAIAYVVALLVGAAVVYWVAAVVGIVGR